ncbi:hypothetical protein B0T16DRAFT_380932 [Cercophora newfieldiana]|uniref:Glutathione S-transferase n=1 Tax=Cercophora newfieldiana TaxID=92897 RepID=A0AA40CK41_9PEZI|nr:hypothetical protein B0T16DRAFT_380932 [Cercophora newfieldiana]
MATPTHDTEKPTLIHLQNSSSQPVLWALEELSIPYAIIPHLRGIGAAPPELKNTHPQGKAPQLITTDGHVLTQLSAILLYLLRKYDTKHQFHNPEQSVDDAAREEYLVCLGVCDMAGKLGSKFMLDGVARMAPWFVRPILSKVRSTLGSMVLDPDVAGVMGVLESELKDGREWFMGGDAPGRADFVLKFFVDLAVMPKYVKLDGYPRVREWRGRCEGREAWKRGLEKGNGYDLDFPAKW